MCHNDQLMLVRYETPTRMEILLLFSLLLSLNWWRQSIDNTNTELKGKTGTFLIDLLSHKWEEVEWNREPILKPHKNTSAKKKLKKLKESNNNEMLAATLNSRMCFIRINHKLCLLLILYLKNKEQQWILVIHFIWLIIDRIELLSAIKGGGIYSASDHQNSAAIEIDRERERECSLEYIVVLNELNGCGLVNWWCCLVGHFAHTIDFSTFKSSKVECC